MTGRQATGNLGSEVGRRGRAAARLGSRCDPATRRLWKGFFKEGGWRSKVRRKRRRCAVARYVASRCDEVRDDVDEGRGGGEREGGGGEGVLAGGGGEVRF